MTAVTGMDRVDEVAALGAQQPGGVDQRQALGAGKAPDQLVVTREISREALRLRLASLVEALVRIPATAGASQARAAIIACLVPLGGRPVRGVAVFRVVESRRQHEKRHVSRAGVF